MSSLGQCWLWRFFSKNSRGNGPSSILLQTLKNCDRSNSEWVQRRRTHSPPPRRIYKMWRFFSFFLPFWRREKAPHENGGKIWTLEVLVFFTIFSLQQFGVIGNAKTRARPIKRARERAEGRASAQHVNCHRSLSIPQTSLFSSEDLNLENDIKNTNLSSLSKTIFSITVSTSCTVELNKSKWMIWVLETSSNTDRFVNIAARERLLLINICEDIHTYIGY